VYSGNEIPFYTSITTHLFDALCMMDNGIVHNKNRLRPRPWTIERKELLNEFLKDGAFIEPGKTRASIMLSCVYAGRV
jgi:hypothetical protein